MGQPQGASGKILFVSVQACPLPRGQQAAGRDDYRQADREKAANLEGHGVFHCFSMRGLLADSLNSLNFAYAFDLMTLGILGFVVLSRGPASLPPRAD